MSKETKTMNREMTAVSAKQDRAHSRAFWLCFGAVAAALALTLAGASSAVAAFGPASFDSGTFTQSGEAHTQASGHPDSTFTTLDARTISEGPDPLTGEPLVLPEGGAVKEVAVDLPPGLIGDPTALDTCRMIDFIDRTDQSPTCPTSSQVGEVIVRLSYSLVPGGVIAFPFAVPLYNLDPSYGSAATFGFRAFGIPPTILEATVRPGDYGVTITSPNITQAVTFIGVDVTFWGNPADPVHDPHRYCPGTFDEFGCKTDAPQRAFLTNAANCTAGPMTWRLAARPWADPDFVATDSILSHLPPGHPAPRESWGPPQGVTGCEDVPFGPRITARPTSQAADSPTGLNVEVTMPTDGLDNPDGIAQSYLRKATVTLPEGMSVNPAVAEGLGVCSPADLGRETAQSIPGEGCPITSKIGSVEIESPVLDEKLEGALFQAKQDDPATAVPGSENPFDSLIALYVVAKSPERGVVVKLSGHVVPDPDTGQLVTTFDSNPQLPFSKFSLKFREGQRSPLVTPPACGTYTSVGQFVPWSAEPENPTPNSLVTSSDQFQITTGANDTPCPRSSASRSFNPGLQAGTLNNNAGSYSPTSIRMTRNDGEQEITSFSADLPPGLVGKLAGVSKCSDAAIEAAKQRTGKEENASPSCPASSLVGRTLAGAGVGSVLAYAPGKVYLAGPYRGSPLSVAAITSATVGPFDLGTVVVRSALKIDPETAQVSVDSAGSDPIPHIVQGIPLHIRDIRVYVDRPDFTLNPTNCNRFNFATRLTGSGADFANPTDDQLFTVANPFQAANCAALPFKPKLSFKLRGGTKRGQFPAFQATLKARPGDANLAKTTVILPRSEFIEQGHIRTVCTRPQFKAQQCPAGSIYGHARAITPLFDTPVEGPVYLRANGGERVLPDLVVSLKNGEIEVALAGFIDSVKGRVRNAFSVIPDAPVTKFTLNMLGGKKGLLVNHLDLCEVTSRADVKMVGQNGKVVQSRPKMGTSCKSSRKGKGRGR